jgi:hypothetical protein
VKAAVLVLLLGGCSSEAEEFPRSKTPLGVGAQNTPPSSADDTAHDTGASPPDDTGEDTGGI